MRTIVLATGNPGKVVEINQMFADLSFTIISQKERCPGIVVKETGHTFLENALLKAEMVCRETGEWVLADDSGLEIDALDGRPGVYSARFAGERATDGDNNAKVLRLLSGVPAADRTARFRCVMALVCPGSQPLTVQGVCEGHILDAPRGTGGFGYDPLFIPAGFRHSFAELDRMVKNSISHRGKAMLNLRKELVRYEAG